MALAKSRYVKNANAMEKGPVLAIDLTFPDPRLLVEPGQDREVKLLSRAAGLLGCACSVAKIN